MSADLGIGTPPPLRMGLIARLANPWAKTRFLWVVAIGYVFWTLIPVVEAVVFSFNQGRSVSQWQGFSLRWYSGDPDGSVLHSPALQHAIFQSLKLASVTAIMAVPLGVAFAIAIHHWRGFGSGGANFLMLFSFVTPELILAVSLFLLVTHAFGFIGQGTVAQLIGLVVLALAYPVVIVRARLVGLGRTYEEAAMDLGASPVGTLRRVTVPMLAPSIFASAAIVFAISLDDFVVAYQLSKDASTQTVSMYIYNAARTGPTPAANAIGTLMLTASTVLILVTVLLLRRSNRKRGESSPLV